MNTEDRADTPDDDDNENDQNEAWEPTIKQRLRLPALERTYHEKGEYKCKFPFLNKKNRKDETLLRIILALAPHRAKYGDTQRRWEEVVVEANEAKDEQGSPIFGEKGGLKLKGARDRFYAYVTFMQKHKGQIPVGKAVDKGEFGAVLQLVQDLYKDYLDSKNNRREMKLPKYTENGSSMADSGAKAAVAVPVAAREKERAGSGDNANGGNKSPAKPTEKRIHPTESVASLEQRFRRREKRKAMKLEIKRRKYDLEQQRIDLERERLDLEKRKQELEEKDREMHREFLMAVAKTLKKGDDKADDGQELQEAVV